MSEAVLISIRPKWCQLIANGEKTVEIRKTFPKLRPPFKCYIYCSMPNTNDPNCILELHRPNGKIKKINGMVMGEFVCDSIMRVTVGLTEYKLWPLRPGSLKDCRSANDTIKAACIGDEELSNYLDFGYGYAWHISDLVLYDELKELKCFRKLCQEKLYCESCAMYNENTEQCGNAALRLRRAPQSWQYVEELEHD